MPVYRNIVESDGSAWRTFQSDYTFELDENRRKLTELSSILDELVRMVPGWSAFELEAKNLTI